MIRSMYLCFNPQLFSCYSRTSSDTVREFVSGILISEIDNIKLGIAGFCFAFEVE